MEIATWKMRAYDYYLRVEQCPKTSWRKMFQQGQLF